MKTHTQRIPRKHSHPVSNRFKDITGMKFNRLTVIRLAGKRRTACLWLCRCDCGAYKKAITTHLQQGLVESCGCLQYENRKLIGKRNLPGRRSVNWKGEEAYHNQIVRDLIYRSKKRGVDFSLTKEEVKRLVNKACFYCGTRSFNKLRLLRRKQTFRYNGIDRIDNDRGYESNNVVPCCLDCNSAKGAMSQEEWLTHIERVLPRLRKLLKHSLQNTVSSKRALGDRTRQSKQSFLL